ncbi:MAG TPA: hypothetical protein VK914_04005 [bacterium]|nr:hypothetical protein [bacterium]
MGTGFTIDTPVKIARYGIHSVVSMGDDRLAERMRKAHASEYGLPYTPILESEPDCRAKRFTAYLDQMQDIVDAQMEAMLSQPLEEGSDLWRCFQLLPDGPARVAFKRWQSEPVSARKQVLERRLRESLHAGRIDVNIMTKVDRTVTHQGVALPLDGSDALAGLRGFANSRVRGSVVFSAGMNPRLYGLLGRLDAFQPRPDGVLEKEVIMKISDYRSAEIQGRYLAKKGVWISEYRMESGLNCGGHAFATDGLLMGPILDEFRSKRAELHDSLRAIWMAAQASRGMPALEPAPARFTAQGGLGTRDEAVLLQEAFGVDATGWGSPFLLVKEATICDEEHRKLLAEAGENEIRLSRSSPLGLPFWLLTTSASERQRLQRIADGKPGSPCPHSYLVYNTEFPGNPQCISSASYQSAKLKVLDADASLNDEERAAAKADVVEKACICWELSGSALKQVAPKAAPPTTVCVGPNLAWFDREASLEEMVDHIYGRFDLLKGKARPHVFVNEMKLYVNYLKEELRRTRLKLAKHPPEYFATFKANLLDGVEFYRARVKDRLRLGRDSFEAGLEALVDELEAIALPALTAPTPA